ncbi:MAG TPA: sugar transporter, partial [Novosphingobium sp.]|nr:sugar transporter [Novosphingobium sp.]
MRKFWIVATLILVWNLIGDAAYLTQATADLDVLAKTDPVTADAFRSMPVWAWAAYALAVGGGTLGAVLLLMRRKVAWAFFALSVAGIVVQFGWTFLGHGLIAAKGW